MNTPTEPEIRYRLLKVLSQESEITQREMARRMGISLGKVNYCLSELGKKGFIKIRRFRVSQHKIQYIYLLTPRGIEEKARLTLNFLRRKISEYEEIKKQIRELAREAGKENLLESLDPETSDAVKMVP